MAIVSLVTSMRIVHCCLKQEGHDFGWVRFDNATSIVFPKVVGG